MRSCARFSAPSSVLSAIGTGVASSPSSEKKPRCSSSCRMHEQVAHFAQTKQRRLPGEAHKVLGHRFAAHAHVGRPWQLMGRGRLKECDMQERAG